MSLPVPITYANAPAGTCPTTIDDLIQLFRDITTAEVSGSYLPYVLGSSTPQVEDQDKAWIRLDAAGRPLGTFLYYAGSWRRQYNGKFNEVTMFNGNPAIFFDGTGRGLTTSEWDGWSLCNGQNGTPNLSDKFIVAAHLDDSGGVSGYVSGWRTTVEGSALGTGGQVEVTLDATNTYRPAVDAIIVDRFDAGAARDVAGKVFGIEDGTSTYDYELVPADAGQTSPDPIPTLPPYFALAYVIFTGYT